MRTRKLAYDRCPFQKYILAKISLRERFKILATGYWRVRTFTIGSNVRGYMTTEGSFEFKKTLGQASQL